MYTLLHQCRLFWLGHVHRMDDSSIPKDLLYGKLAKRKHLVERPKLCYKDVCKRDLKSTGSNVETWEALANDRKMWRAEMCKTLLAGEQHFTLAIEEKRAKRKANYELPKTLHEAQFICQNLICESQIGLFSHSKCCTQPTVR